LAQFRTERFLQKIQFKKMVRIVRIRIDQFAIALFGFVTGA